MFLISVGLTNFNTQSLHLLRSESFQTAFRADRHEYGRVDEAMTQSELASSRISCRALCLDVKE